MKKILLMLSCYLSWVAAMGQASDKAIAIIPEPVKMVQNTGSFRLPENISIQAPALPALKGTLDSLKARLSVPTGYNVNVSEQASNPTVKLAINKTANAEIGREGYQLSVTPAGISLSANEPAGLFYGVQTLLRILICQEALLLRLKVFILNPLTRFFIVMPT